MKNSVPEIAALTQTLSNVSSIQHHRATNGLGWHVEEWYAMPVGWKAITVPYPTFQEAVDVMNTMQTESTPCVVERRVYEALDMSRGRNE